MKLIYSYKICNNVLETFQPVLKSTTSAAVPEMYIYCG